MTITAGMSIGEALGIARATRRATDIDLSMAYDELEYACDGLEVDDMYDLPPVLPYTQAMLVKAMDAIDAEIFRREEFFPECSRAGMREKAAA